jgi:hypothetical protein
LTEFVPEARGSRDRIRLKVFPARNAVVSFLHASGLKPEQEHGELVSIHRYDPEIARRIVSAMAVMHLGLREAETNFSAADVTMIDSQFVIGTFRNTHPAWVKGDGKMYSVILNAAGTGLPAIPTDPAQSRLLGPEDSSVTYHANNLEDGLRVISNGYLRFSYVPKKSVDLFASAPQGILLH